MYGRFENGKIKIAKHYIKTNNKTIINPTDAIYKENGYKQIIEEEPPVLLENQGAELYYEEQEDVIIKRYKIVEIENYEDLSTLQEKAEAYDIIVGGIV